MKKENRGGKTKGVVSKKKKSKGLTKKTATQELLTHPFTTKKVNPSFLIHSFSLAEDNEETLEHLKQTATDRIGRPISSSAILRALLRFLAQQPSPWIATQLHPLIETEIESGRLWGTKGKTADHKERKAVHRSPIFSNQFPRKET